MPLPQPTVPLTDVCSVIFNNTLYTYSTNAFQSLSLTPGAQWKKLQSGESIEGGVCVGSTPKDASQAAFYVVGGKGPGADYTGLQRYIYATGKWERLAVAPPVTQDRLWHGATYLNSSDTILVYAGSQDGSQNPSSQTFTIKATGDHEVLAYESIAPPTINPMLLPWSETHAVLIGGSEFNSQVMLFSYESKMWTDSGASLAQPLTKNSTAIKAAIVTADDGCKSLYTFDMTLSPNEVNRTVLINGAGAPVQNSVMLTARSVEKASSRITRMERRDSQLTEGGWPKYNSSLVSSAVRSNYAVAEDSNGLVVIAGGSDEDVLCMFEGRNNRWVNATERLGEQKLIVQDTPPTTESLAPTSSPTPAAGAAPAGAESGQPTTLSSNTVLGIVLGAISGLALLLVIAYILIRRRRRRQEFFEAGHNRRSSGAASPEKGGFAYATESHMTQGPALGTFRGHQQQASQDSYSSMAILMGRVNQPKPGVQRQNSAGSKRLSASSMFKTALKSSISKPIPQQSAARDLTAVAPPQYQARDERAISFGRDVAEPRPRSNKPDRQGSTRRSSGWNRYWSGGSALNILGFGNRGQDSKRATVDSDQSSRYSADIKDHRITQDSATVPPLHVHTPLVPTPKFQRVNSGSPTLSAYDARIKDEMRAQIERSNSRASDRSGYSSGIPASIHDAWDPTASNRPWGADRAPSSAYANFTTPLHHPASSHSSVAGKPSGVSRQPQLTTAATSSDMSWLNLGDFTKL
jgi:hypothetical protein